MGCTRLHGTISPAISGILRKYAWTGADQLQQRVIAPVHRDAASSTFSQFLLTSALALLTVLIKPNDRREIPADESYSLPSSLTLPPLSFFFFHVFLATTRRSS
jgi:hypothetical protein